MSDTCSSWRSCASHVGLRVQWVAAVFRQFVLYVRLALWCVCSEKANRGRSETSVNARSALWRVRAWRFSFRVHLGAKIQFAEASAVVRLRRKKEGRRDFKTSATARWSAEVRSRAEIQFLCALTCEVSVCRSERCGAFVHRKGDREDFETSAMARWSALVRSCADTQFLCAFTCGL